jgi:photosystem II stability/assembly factor-like uncharacterized protein
VGGIARLAPNQTWQLHSAGLPITSVTSLSSAGASVLAGGAEGIVRSVDEGASWHLAEVEGQRAGITALVVSPRFAEDGTALAATLDGGVLRSSDAGRSWKYANVGLASFEVTGLLWQPDEVVLAATADGIYRSPNAGRAWRLVGGTEGHMIDALAGLPDGHCLAACANGNLLRSLDYGCTWSHVGTLPMQTQISAIVASADRLLLGSTSHGTLCSHDGVTWTTVLQKPVLSLTAESDAMYAGTDTGVQVSVDGGQTWRALPTPPLHDLRRLLLPRGRPMLVGRHTGILSWHDERQWQPLVHAPRPITAVAETRDGVVWASGPAGLARSEDAGATWEIRVPGDAGWVGHITFDATDTGWAGSADGRRLLRTRDAGQRWESLDPPFGVLLLVALAALSDALLAATYDRRQQRVQLWRSFDAGSSWERGAEVQTVWPNVATSADPPLVTLGSNIFWQSAQRQWNQTALESNSLVHRIVGEKRQLFMLAADGLYRSADDGQSWTLLRNTPPIDRILDVALDDETLYVLLIGGQLQSCSLSSLVQDESTLSETI